MLFNILNSYQAACMKEDHLISLTCIQLAPRVSPTLLKQLCMLYAGDKGSHEGGEELSWAKQK